MKLKLHILAGSLIAGCLLHQVGAQPVTPVAPEASGSLTVTAARAPAKAVSKGTRLVDLQVRNFQNERLGHMQDLGVDLANGRIVEVVVATGGFLGFNEKYIAVPTLAMGNDNSAGVYRLDISPRDFKAAPSVNLSSWDAVIDDRQVAASYRWFGQEANLRPEGATPGLAPDGQKKMPIGQVVISSDLFDLPVKNLDHQVLGRVSSLRLDLQTGRILNVVILDTGHFLTCNFVSPKALTYLGHNAGLLLDETKEQFQAEPHYLLSQGLNGRPDRAKIQLGAAAIAQASADTVDNQIVVSRPLARR